MAMKMKKEINEKISKKEKKKKKKKVLEIKDGN